MQRGGSACRQGATQCPDEASSRQVIILQPHLRNKALHNLIMVRVTARTVRITNGPYIDIYL